jgi:hypothetical protein
MEGSGIVQTSRGVRRINVLSCKDIFGIRKMHYNPKGKEMNVEIIASVSSAIIALVALIFSMVTLKRQQDRADTYARASVRPLLSIKSQNYLDLKSIRIVNYGVGPAVIRKAEFRRGSVGVPTNKIVDLFNLNIIWESFVNVPPN